MKCPKCGYQRTANSANPAWQCPECGIAYHKYNAYLDKVKQVSRPREREETNEPVHMDGSLWSLLAANLFVLFISVLDDWSLANMMLVYCAQSLVIGISYFMRMLSLDKFSTKNFKINNRSVEPTTQTKVQTAIFFAFHFGFFHFVYLLFIFSGQYGDPGLNIWFYLCCRIAVLTETLKFGSLHVLYHRGPKHVGRMEQQWL